MHRIDWIFAILYILLSCRKDTRLSYNPVYPVIPSKQFPPSLPLGQTCKTLYKITKRRRTNAVCMGRKIKNNIPLLTPSFSRTPNSCSPIGARPSFSIFLAVRRAAVGLTDFFRAYWHLHLCWRVAPATIRKKETETND